MAIKRSEAIKRFLDQNTHIDLAALYNHDMECQVNVSPEGGYTVDRKYKSRGYRVFTDKDQLETWNDIRIPLNAKDNPQDNDSEINFDLSKHVEGIGMTGWDWVNLCSRWVAFDFDGITGHSDKRENRLNTTELDKVTQIVKEFDYVTIRKSTSGSGLHLYIFLDAIPTKNHTEHAALAKAILVQMSVEAGFPFLHEKVDVQGGNMWVYHRKMKNSRDGLTLIKSGGILRNIPAGWKEFIGVGIGRRRRAFPSGIIKDVKEPEKIIDAFDEITSTQVKTPLDEEHRKLLDYLQQRAGASTWLTDNMMVTHTIYLQDAHKELNLRGVFETVSTGREYGADWNAFCFPLKNGAWKVVRYTKGTKEHDSWIQDSVNWTWCIYNRDPDLKVAAKTYKGIETKTGAFQFRRFDEAQKAIDKLGLKIKLPDWVADRETIIRKHKDGRLIIEILREKDLDGLMVNQLIELGFVKGQKYYEMICEIKINSPITAPDVPKLDNHVRHIVVDDKNIGWVINSDNTWREEPLDHVKVLLRGHLGFKQIEVDAILGLALEYPWELVNRPFEPEYPAERKWNRHAVKLKYKPTANIENPYFPHWQKILNHLGKSLDVAIQSNKWANTYGIKTGADYLKLWIASLFQHPTLPLPYLFFFSEKQNTGKTIFWESIASLMSKEGFQYADMSLKHNIEFNAELEGAVLCVIEETDLNTKRGGSLVSYNKIKNWVTSTHLPIHRKNRTPYKIINTSHFVQCANDRNACPVFSGDTRIVVISVEDIPEAEIIPKPEFLILLEKEAPDFLAELLNIEIPPSNDRLNIPAILTSDKEEAESRNESPIEQFFNEFFYCPGESIPWGELYSEFSATLSDDEKKVWGRNNSAKHVPKPFVKGRDRNNNQVCVGNISRTQKPSTLPKLILIDGILYPEGEKTHASQNSQTNGQGKDNLL